MERDQHLSPTTRRMGCESSRWKRTAGALHQAIGQAFVDALHGSFLISAVCMLVTALLVGLLIGQKQRATRKSRAEAGVPVTPGTNALQLNPEMV